MAKKKKSFMTPKASRRKARKKRTTVTGRKKKEFTYRGFQVEELKEMPLWPSEEDPSSPSVITLLTSRARRSIARGLSTENEHFIDRMRRSTVAQFARTAVTSQSCLSSLERELLSTMDRIS
jgi:small subunit ribosomal protein S19